MHIHVEDRIGNNPGSRYTPELRTRLKAWLKNTMNTRGWNAEKWAKEAQIAPTTITRFLNSEDLSRIPSARTLEKLARAAGVPAMHEQNQVFIAILNRSKILKKAKEHPQGPLELLKMPADDYLPVPPKYADCLTVRMDGGTLAIVRPCPREGCKDGWTVMVERNGESISPYLFKPPVLVSVDMTAGKVDVRSIDCEDIRILGRVVADLIEHDDDD